MADGQDLRYSTCCICNGGVGVLVAKSAYVNAPWGFFQVYFHEACTDVALITKKLNDMALAAKP